MYRVVYGATEFKTPVLELFMGRRCQMPSWRRRLLLLRDAQLTPNFANFHSTACEKRSQKGSLFFILLEHIHLGKDLNCLKLWSSSLLSSKEEPSHQVRLFERFWWETFAFNLATINPKQPELSQHLGRNIYFFFWINKKVIPFIRETRRFPRWHFFAYYIQSSSSFYKKLRLFRLNWTSEHTGQDSSWNFKTQKLFDLWSNGFSR